MKRIMFFCIPAHGHTNPMLAVATELVKRGNEVRFYSFNEFKDKIEKTGANFISCDSFLEELSSKEEENLKKVSTTEMTIQDIKATLNMDGFLDKEFKEFQPDVIYTDSVCFWGKLNAWKHNVPMVVSTSTFAFNQLSSKYMKNSFAEICDLVFGLPKIAKALKSLKPLGYNVKNPIALVQSDNKTDSIVYTSRRFQPYSKSFSDHYEFIGPSVSTDKVPEKNSEKPLVYISMGTVINDRPDFYNKCICALKDLDVEIIISCGKTMDIDKLGTLPENVKVYPYVNQLEVLSKASVFISHCGMNSVSESLYMATPLVLYPQTKEQYAVARRAYEIDAGIMLKSDTVEGIRNAVKTVLDDANYSDGAKACREDFLSCPSVEGAAKFIESAPHESNGEDVLAKLNAKMGIYNGIYWLIALTIMVLFGIFVGWDKVWILGVLAGFISKPIINIFFNRKIKELL